MFDQIKPQNKNDQPVEDIFLTADQPKTPSQPQAASESVPAPVATPPPSPVTTPQPTGPTQPLQNLKDINVPPLAKKKRSFLSVIFIIILLGIVVALAYFAYGKFFSSQAENTNLIQPNINQEAGNKNTNKQPEVPEIVIPPIENQNQNVNIVLDTDHDGLTDNEEKTIGTNPNEVDTDGDNLFDYEEVKTFMTNPLNPDTDNDGYLDGEEVLNGYDPLGPGKLLNF